MRLIVAIFSLMSAFSASSAYGFKEIRAVDDVQYEALIQLIKNQGRTELIGKVEKDPSINPSDFAGIEGPLCQLSFRGFPDISAYVSLADFKSGQKALFLSVYVPFRISYAVEANVGRNAVQLRGLYSPPSGGTRESTIKIEIDENGIIRKAIGETNYGGEFKPYKVICIFSDSDEIPMS